MLELGLEELHHLDRGPGRARDRDAGEVVGREHLVDAAAGDRVARRRPAVARHHHAVGVADRDHGRAVRDVEPGRRPAHRCSAAGAGSPGAGARRTRARDRYSGRTAVTRSVQTSSAEPTAATQRLSASRPLPNNSSRARHRGEMYATAASARSSSSSSRPIATLHGKQRMPRTRPVS